MLVTLLEGLGPSDPPKIIIIIIIIKEWNQFQIATKRREKRKYHPPRLLHKEDPVRIGPESDPLAPLKEKAQIYADVKNISLSLSKRRNEEWLQAGWLRCSRPYPSSPRHFHQWMENFNGRSSSPLKFVAKLNSKLE